MPELTAPSPGIFIDAMQHLLVLCTQSTLIVLGLAAPDTPPDSNTTSQEFVVYDTELRFSTENVPMTSIVSTNSGRAFMCGTTDGHLYELQYQATEGWFGGKSSLINHSVSGVASFLPSLFSSASSGERLAHYHRQVIGDSQSVLGRFHHGTST